MTQYKIGSSGCSHWLNCGAKTLNGAKMLASKTFRASVGGRIQVGEVMNAGSDCEVVVPVAAKQGFGKLVTFCSVATTSTKSPKRGFCIASSLNPAGYPNPDATTRPPSAANLANCDPLAISSLWLWRNTLSPPATVSARV